MLMKMGPPSTRPATFVFTGSYTVKLTVGLKCPHCSRQLHASDIELDFGDVKLICAGCHKDVLTIGSAS